VRRRDKRKEEPPQLQELGLGEQTELFTSPNFTQLPGRLQT
jgi:hypothetical protein